MHWKGQFESFHNLLTVHPTHAQVACVQSYADHVQHMLCCVPRGTKGQLSY